MSRKLFTNIFKIRPRIRQYSSRGIQRVTVIGGGLMGAGIAQVAAQGGNLVQLVDDSPGTLNKAQDRVEKSLERVAKKRFKDKDSDTFIGECLGRLTFTSDVHASVKSCDLVVEAIVVDLKEKQNLFRVIDKVAPPTTIFSTNSSSFPIHEIAASVRTRRKEGFAGLHFLTPVAVIKLVEIVRIPETSEDTHDKLVSWATSLGKVPVTCGDTTGFIMNRLFVPYIMNAVRMLERGDATAEDIDTAMKLGAGHLKGPLELADFLGLDMFLSVLEDWAKRCPENPSFTPPQLLRRMVREGKLGVQSGQGFYNYEK